MTETDSVEKTVASPSRGRAVAVVVFLVVAALLTTPSLLAFWGQRTINDTQRYVDTVGPLVKYPAVQSAVATRVTTALEDQVDVEALLNQAFAGVITDRPRLKLLIGPISGAVNGLIESQVRAFVASDAFAELWVNANTRLQQALLHVLRGDDVGAVSVQGDQVVLDVSQVIDRVKQRLEARGLTFVSKLPTSSKDRQIVLLKSPQLKQARTIYALGNPVAQWLIWLVVALFLGAFILSRRRARTAVVIGLVIALNALLLALFLSIGRQLFVNQLEGTVFGPASRVFYNVLLVYLTRADRALLVLGLILVVAGWFAGRNGSGTAARTTIGRGLETVGSSLGHTAVARPGLWVRENVGWLRVVAVTLGFVVLAWGNDITRAKLLWSLVLVLVLLAILQVLVGAGAGRGTAVASPDPVPAAGPGSGTLREAEPGSEQPEQPRPPPGRTPEA